ncbi:MAG: AMP-binding protein, partial [Thermoleophilaceae bacterium]
MTFNVISEVLPHATSAPDRIALAVHREPRDVNSVETATFRQLVDRAERFAAGLEKAGIGFGDRVILASAPSVDFYALALALLGHGGALVLIDGAMDRRRLLGAMRASRASAIVSIDAVMKRWPLVPPLWRMRRYSVDRARPGVRVLDGLAGDGGAAVSAGFPRLVEGDTPGVISFTSGTSGRAKGANRTTGILMAQHHALARDLPLEPGDVDMTCFPAVVLHNLACGVTTVLPPLDLRHPATVDPPLVTEAMRRFSVTTMTGAPAYLTKLARHIVDSGEPPSTVRRVVAGGAPVPRRLCELLIEAFPRAEVVVVYGSTEAEPISHVHAEEVRDRPGEGLLVGAPVAEIELEVLTLPDSIERTWTPDEIAAARTPLGEVVVAGAHVNRDYFGDPGANALNKLHEPGGKV